MYCFGKRGGALWLATPWQHAGAFFESGRPKEALPAHGRMGGRFCGGIRAPKLASAPISATPTSVDIHLCKLANKRSGRSPSGGLLPAVYTPPFRSNSSVAREAKESDFPSSSR